jgi:glycosyltransferase involved in cell wall biosynthesis
VHWSTPGSAPSEAQKLVRTLECMSVTDPVDSWRRRTKTVLVIDYFFPPLAGAGVQRTLGFVRYLTQFGWAPIVLTVQGGDTNFYDASLVEWIPSHVDVHRTASFEPIGLIRRLATKESLNGDRQITELHLGAGVFAPILRRLRQLEYWLLFPDRHVGWIPFAIARIPRIRRRCPVDLVFSISTSVTSHVVGYAAKKMLRVPWVAEFQDPWADGSATRLFPSAVHQNLARRLEAMILRNADHVTVTADPLRRSFEQRNGRGLAGKVTVIPSGYDPYAFDERLAVPRPRFCVTHCGSFYAARSPVPFLEALGRCVREHPCLAEDLEVRLLGIFDPALRALAVGVIERWGLRNVVRLEGAVSYTAGVRAVMSSDVLLLIADSGQWARSTVPAKLYEYLAARKPVLAMLPDGPAAELLRKTNAGVIVAPGDIQAIKRAIWDLYRRGKDGRLAAPVQNDLAEQYDWRTLAGRLAGVFDDVQFRRGAAKARSEN